jgi:hypothetical protein
MLPEDHTDPHEPRGSHCPTACTGCGSDDAADAFGSDGGAAASDGPLAGWSMAGAGLVFFLVPLIAAAAGAVLTAGRSPGWQLLGGTAGLAAGMTLAAVVGRRVSRRIGARS